MGLASIGIRISGLLLFAPFFGSDAIAPRIKIGLVVAITALLYPVCGPRALELSPSGILRVAVGELLVGLLLGLSVELVFEAAQFAGQLMGVQVGFSLVNILDPNTQVDTPVLSLFSQTIVTLIFLGFGMHRCLLRGLAASFAYLPPGAISLPGDVAQELAARGGRHLADRGADRRSAADYYLAGGFSAGFSGQGVAPVAGVVSRPVGEKSGRPVAAGGVTAVLARDLRAAVHHAARGAEQMLHLAH